MPIAARSAPNNGQVKEAKVSFCTRGTGKAVNGKAKRDVNRRANGDERRDIREDIRQAKREDKNKNIKGEIRKGRRENKFGDKERNGKREGWEREVQPDHQPRLYLQYSKFHQQLYKYIQIHHSYVPNLILLIGIFIIIFIIIFFIISNNISLYIYSRKLSTRTSSIKHHIISFIFSPHGMSYISSEI